MRHRATLVLMACLTVCRWGTAASGDGSAVSGAYANVEVVSVDPSTRLIVIRSSTGAEETFEFDANLAGAEGIKAGDRVIMTVRGEPGRKRVSAISKATPSRAASDAKPDATPVLPAPNEEAARTATRERFSSQVADLSQRARPIDGLWSSFSMSCAARPASSAEGGREWFGLWDGRVKADLSSGFCRDLFNQIVTAGEGVKKAMAAAEEGARKTLDPGEVRDIRTLHSMDWEGWTLPAPAKLQP
jgi:hypothetical protein